jgi:O-antigen ligase
LKTPRPLACDVLHHAGLAALCVYTVGVLNPHSTALRQYGFYIALAAALAIAAMQPRQVVRIAREPLAWWLGGVALFAVVATLVSPRPAYSAWQAYNELGFLVLSAFATALIVRRALDADVLLWASVVAAVDVSIYSIAQYLRERDGAPGWPLPDIHRHRYYAEPLLWFFPALLWGLGKARKRWLPLLGAGFALYLLLLAATGSRAAWYAAMIAAIVWFSAESNRARIIVAGVALVAAIVLALWIVPPDIFFLQVARGVWASHRVHGAWVPALELIFDRPWLGHGYGEELFHAAYNAEVATHPGWYFRESLGPHNVFLALWFAGGIGLVGCILGLLVSYVRYVGRALVATAGPAWRTQLLAGACSVLAYLVIRGTFESIPFRVCGLAFGVALASACERRRAFAETPRQQVRSLDAPRP